MHMTRLRSGDRVSWALGVALLVACQSDAGRPIEVGAGPPPEPPSEMPNVTVEPPNPELNCEGVAPGAAEARLLTRLQYDNTVRDLLGDLTAPARGFPPENTLLGFGNNADAHRVSLLLAERHAAAGEAVARAAVARGVDALLPCEAGDRSEDCVSRFITAFGYRAFRRPLAEGESEPFLSLFRQASPLWGFDTALGLVIQAFLQSPQHLYRTESLVSAAGASPVTAGDDAPALPLDSYQIASRLLYFLWNTMPDPELFALADTGQLGNLDTVREQARRMLDDDRARATVTDFYQQWMGVSQFAGLTRVAPGTESVSDYNVSWGQSLDQFVQHTFWDEGGNVSALLSSPSVFMDPALSALYGVEAGPQPYLDPNRAGILTQPGLMALLAHPEQSAPVQRGKFVREQLLCQQLPPPPPDVDTTPPDPDPNATTRERFSQHSADARCAQCHRLLDTVGFGLEAFDHLGGFRTEEYGLPVDTSGDVVDSGDPNLEGAFNGAIELSTKLAASPQVEACLATQWFRYGMGRAEQEEDVCSLERAKTDFASTGGDFKELLVSLATTDAFRFRPFAEQDL